MSDITRLTEALSDRYRIERELGGGGMSRVWVATETALDRQVVVKVIASELTEGLSAERFAREVRLAARLQQANIVPVLHAGTAAGLPYYTMPYVRGESLRARMTGGAPLTLTESVSILRDVARALAYAHGEGIVHRDIKPENVLLSHGAAMVTDFGIAKALTALRTQDGGTSVTLTQAGGSIGTPAYMAPEQAVGDAVDHRTDLYAWGVMAYEMLTGAHPFGRHSTPQQLVTAHLTETPAPITAKNPTVPPALAALVLQCLEKDPARRPVSAAAVLTALETVATPVPSQQMTAARAPRRMTGVLVAAAVLGVALAVWAIRPHGIATAPAGPIRLAVVPFDNAGPADQAYFAEGLVDEVRTRLTELSGLRVVARTSSEAYRGTTNTPQQIGKELGVQYLLTGRVRWQEAAPGRPAQVRISPELIRAEDGTTAWEKSFDADPSDAFAVQRRIAGEVSQALNLALTPQDSSSAGARPTENAAAYDAYLQGEALLHQAEHSDYDGRPAAALLTHAVELDSGFALAWARLSYAHMMLYWNFNDRSSARLGQGADAAARAQALAPTLPEAHLAAAYVRYWGHRDYEGARRELDQALKTRPNDVKLLVPYGYVARRSGHFDEAIATMRREVDLDPRNAIAIEDLAHTLTYVQPSGTSEPLFERTVLLSPQLGNLWMDWIYARTEEGNPDRIRDVIHRAETALGKGFTAWFLTNEHYGRHLLLATVVEPELRARLLATSITSDFPVDSAGMWLMKAALARSAGDAAGVARYAETAWSITGRLALRDSAEPNWPLWKARAALLRGRTDEAIREGRRSLEMLPPSFDHVEGPDRLAFLAAAHAMAGHADSALGYLKALLAIPSHLRAGGLRLSPEFASLRNDPRFVKLLEGAQK